MLPTNLLTLAFLRSRAEGTAAKAAYGRRRPNAGLASLLAAFALVAVLAAALDTAAGHRSGTTVAARSDSLATRTR